MFVTRDVGGHTNDEISAVHRTDFVDDNCDSVGSDVGHHDVCTLIGEQMGGCSPHATCGTGDDDCFAGNRTAEFGQARHSKRPPIPYAGR